MSMLEQAPASAAAGIGELLSNTSHSLLRTAARLPGAWRGRRLVKRMRNLDDAQLFDIGLKRSDIDGALQLPFSADPSLYLAQARLKSASSAHLVK
jgi:uncharacterized protein YjiS (DUF1127 family)